jgi:hypothetical protein
VDFAVHSFDADGYKKAMRASLRTTLPFALIFVSACHAPEPATPAGGHAEPASPPSAAPAAPAPNFETDHWGLYKTTIDGRPGIVRYREGLAPFAGDPAFPVRIEIIAELIRPFDDGMPKPDDARALDPIEDEIVRQFEVPQKARFAAVLTGNGARTFLLMSRSDNVTSQFEAVRAVAQGRPLHLQVLPDRDWARFRSLQAR